MKFSDKSKIDGLIVNKGIETVVEDNPNTFNRIALSYDLIPEEFISLVVSEVGLLPASSVSVVLRDLLSYERSKTFYPEDLNSLRSSTINI